MQCYASAALWTLIFQYQTASKEIKRLKGTLMGPILIWAAGVFIDRKRQLIHPTASPPQSPSIVGDSVRTSKSFY